MRACRAPRAATEDPAAGLVEVGDAAGLVEVEDATADEDAM